MELIVTEKDNVARRIADILSDGTATADRSGEVATYAWDDRLVVGLSGHVVGLDFPAEYANWRDVEPRELVHADVVTTPTHEAIVERLQALARDADRVVIATDYDREGELIGKEAMDLVREVAPDVPVDRVRFSSITPGEVEGAFADPDELDLDLAAAGEARQEIDLVWGAALTRFLSLTAGRRGEDFVSVGRVQSPTLKLVVDKEREIEAFEPEDYWELAATLGTDGTAFEADHVYEDADGTQAQRLWDETRAEAVAADLRGVETATVTEVRERTRTDSPPTPFDTTAFIGAAGSLGFAASEAMDLAESLYTDGYITYPRTDNTVYPDDEDLDGILAALTDGPFGEDATAVRELGREPTAGEEETTDHPPIHPTTDLPDRADLGEGEWTVYELVVRRFLATLSAPATWTDLRVVATAAGHDLRATGRRLQEPGYLSVYPYASASESELPAVAEGDTIALSAVDLQAKETHPPRRYGESRLIELMAEKGVGTKSTRHNTIEKLYDRGYLEDDPPRPTALARAVVTAAEEYADLVTSEEMTAQLEADMAAIAEGEATLAEVTAESRRVLERVFEDLADSRDEVGQVLRDAMKADRTLGPCPECGDDLLVRESSRGGHFVGCDGYPDCEYTLPLPEGGEPTVTDTVCPDHGLAEVKILDGRSTFVHGCPRCRADEADRSEDREIGACPDCGAEAGGRLAVKQLRNGNRLVGCTRYPDCEYSLPLPRKGNLEVREEEVCEEHDLPALVIQDGDEPWELGCPVCNYREYRQRQARRDVTSVDGVGPATADQLAAAGIETVGDLRAADPAAVTDVDGLTADRLSDLIEAAGGPDPDGTAPAAASGDGADQGTAGRMEEMADGFEAE